MPTIATSVPRGARAAGSRASCARLPRAPRRARERRARARIASTRPGRGAFSRAATPTSSRWRPPRALAERPARAAAARRKKPRPSCSSSSPPPRARAGAAVPRGPRPRQQGGRGRELLDQHVHRVQRARPRPHVPRQARRASSARSRATRPSSSSARSRPSARRRSRSSARAPPARGRVRRRRRARPRRHALRGRRPQRRAVQPMRRRSPGKEEFYETHPLLLAPARRRALVGVRLGAAVDAAQLVDAGFESVVVATGGTPRTPPIEGVGHAKVLSCATCSAARPSAEARRGRRRGRLVGFGVAEFLAHGGAAGPEGAAARADDAPAAWPADGQLPRGVGHRPDDGSAAGSRRAPSRARRARGLPAAAHARQARRRLGKTTGWIHPANLTKKGVTMIGGVTYERVDDAGDARQRAEGQGQGRRRATHARRRPRRALRGPGQARRARRAAAAAGVRAFVVGGAERAPPRRVAKTASAALAAVIAAARPAAQFEAPVPLSAARSCRGPRPAKSAARDEVEGADAFSFAERSVRDRASWPSALRSRAFSFQQRAAARRHIEAMTRARARARGRAACCPRSRLAKEAAVLPRPTTRTRARAVAGTPGAAFDRRRRRTDPRVPSGQARPEHRPAASRSAKCRVHDPLRHGHRSRRHSGTRSAAEASPWRPRVPFERTSTCAVRRLSVEGLVGRGATSAPAALPRGVAEQPRVPPPSLRIAPKTHVVSVDRERAPSLKKASPTCLHSAANAAAIASASHRGVQPPRAP